MYIGVTGVTGVGKTTLAQNIANHLNYTFIAEHTEENPYLSDYYLDMKRWSFGFDAYLTTHTVERYLRVPSLISGGVVTDQIFEVDRAYTEMRYMLGLMENRDYNTLCHIQTQFQTFLPQPDVVILLHSRISTALSRIKDRNRQGENNINYGYLKALCDCMHIAVSKLTVPVVEINWEKYQSVEEVLKRLDGIVKYG